MHPFLEQHLPSIEQLCLKHKVSKLYVFGSLASGRFDEKNSDADFIVAFEPSSNRGLAQNYLNLMVDLSKILQRSVDLLLDEPIENPYFKEELDETKMLIYEQAGEEVLV
ncbi:nucleotidyltransferase family protein [Haliscomenobacter hydrossis]|uniref:DNA polymerase beta domain protein region n=1 Tax=Haliscomenobacter hydrossis (strain ATCC 27775 / DSM 1100 / LMG 10767 / O) TaxID=760192 RepID=F4KQB6_HALH1|nr:nucleotidyltransferase domain-containing protein [Haliscomenobacter hydrossis]AEE48942.1 DNA polymerase beta domain protein region [Haliscomenobacter hydrossis DSM 1100]